MSAANYNLEIDEGTTFRRTLTYETEDRSIIPIVDAHLQARKKKSSDATVLDLTVGDGLSIDDDGVLTILLEDEQTSDLGFTSAVYDLKLTLAGDEKDRVIEGVVTVSQEVTH